MISLDDIKTALTDGELRLFFQPKVGLLNGEVIGAEALIRWCRKDGTIVGPDNFIHIAEEGNILHAITLEMLNQAVETIELVREHFPGLSISMNVTPYDLESHHVSEVISSHLSQGRIQPTDLQVEITESAVMTRFDQVYADIVQLNKMGIDVLMDDFGIGYSSVDRLSQLPFSSLKLDKGVVTRMNTSRQNLNVVKSSISMARELRMTSIAEGVESEAVYNFLLASGCEQAQGFWISRPLHTQGYLEFLGQSRVFHGSQIGRVHQGIMNIVQFRKSLLDAAFCKNIAADAVLDAVIDPEVRLLAEDSRFGRWYYGIGQALSGVNEFDALEPSFSSMYNNARKFMHALKSNADQGELDRKLQAVDRDLAELVTGLNNLERHLLLTGENKTGKNNSA